MTKQLNTEIEDKILEAAKQVFTEKGLVMTKMSDIANIAGISRTSLNYYYRSKENLFQAIIGQVAELFWPDLETVLEADLSVSEKIEGIVEKYTNMLISNPLIPQFMSIEVRRDLNQLLEILSAKTGKFGAFKNFQDQIKQEMLDGKIKKTSIPHLIVTIASLCIFPFVAEPILTKVFLNNNSGSFEEFIKERQKIIMGLVNNLLEVK